MKNLIFAFILLASLKSNAQVSVNLTAGKTSFSPVLQGEVQYGTNWIIQGVLSSHLDREDPAFIGVRYGYNFQLNNYKEFNVQPLFGLHYVWVTFHNTPLNYYDFGFGAALTYKHFKFEMYNIDKYAFVGVGITGLTLK
jgi:hypothetical protein